MTKKQYFQFPSIDDSERLSYEYLSAKNSVHLYEMFYNDKSLFVDKRFKKQGEVDKYVRWLGEAKYLSKNAGCDWLIFNKKNRIPVGILHLYDLSTETFNNINKKCFIGFSIAENQRRKYHASEAIIHFLRYIFNNFEMQWVLAYTLRKNEAANNLLKQLKFKEKTDDDVYNEQFEYYEMEKGFFIDTFGI